MDGRGPTRERNGCRDADQFSELPLERIDMRPQRSHPTGVERVEEKLALRIRNVWGRQGHFVS